MNPEQANKFNTILWAVTFTVTSAFAGWIFYRILLGYLTTAY